MYLGLAAVGAGGYYMYRAGGDPQTAKRDIKREFSSLDLWRRHGC